MSYALPLKFLTKTVIPCLVLVWWTGIREDPMIRGRQFDVYLVMLPVTQNLQGRMLGWIINNALEGMCKETLLTYFGVLYRN
jgi:hypothetical protein